MDNSEFWLGVWVLVVIFVTGGLCGGVLVWARYRRDPEKMVLRVLLRVYRDPPLVGTVQKRWDTLDVLALMKCVKEELVVEKDDKYQLSDYGESFLGSWRPAHVKEPADAPSPHATR